MAVLRHDFEPGEPTHHWKINSAETHAGKKNVDAIAERLVIERLDRVRNGFGAIRVAPTVIHFFMRFFDRHPQRRVGHGERYELLPVFAAGEAAGGLEA